MKLYLRSTTSNYAPTAGKKSANNPANALGANNASSAQESLSLSTIKGASGGGTNHSFSSDASTAARSNYLGRWTSEPLTAQSIAAGTWTIALGLNESNTNAKSFTAIAVYIAAQGGAAKKATIYDSGASIGTEWSTSTTGAGRVITFSGSSVSVDAGDVLVIEIFRNATQTMATAYSQILYFDGATEPTASSNVTAADVASYLDTPAAITLAEPVFSQSAAQFEADDGTESGSTVISGGSSITRDISGGNVALRVRARISETGGIVGGDATDDFELRFSKNGGAYQSLVAIGVADSYAFANADSTASLPSNVLGRAQSFTGDGNVLDSIKLSLLKTGSPTGTGVVKVYAHSGTYGTNSVPTGAALATSGTINVADLTTSAATITFNFTSTNRITLTNGTRYVLAFEHTSLDFANYCLVRVDNSSPTHGGNASTNNGGVWSANAWDLVFEVVTQATLAVEAFNSTNLTEGQATSSRLSGGAGKVTEDGTVDDLQIGAGASKELLASVNLIASQLANTNTLDFRFYRNGQPLDSYVVTPRITIGTGGGAQYTLTAQTGSFALAGQQSVLKAARKLAGNVGSFALTGQSAGLNRRYPITAQKGDFTLTGNAIALKAARKLISQTGSFALTGQTAILKRNLLLTNQTGAFALTGINANILKIYRAIAQVGAFNLTGNSANLLANRKLAGQAGAFALAGQDAAVSKTRVLAAETGGFNLTGIDAALLRTLRIAAQAGEFNLTAPDANLLTGRRMAAQTGSFTLAGQPANLLRVVSLTAESGAFALTGEQINLLANRRLQANAGTFAVTGADAELTYYPLLLLVLEAQTGVFNLSGNDAALNYNRALRAEKGEFNLTGNTADLFTARVLYPQTGAFALSGQPASLLRSRRLESQTGTFTLSGNQINLLAQRLLSATTALFNLTGANATLTLNQIFQQFVLTALTGEFSLSGQPANLLFRRELKPQTGVFTLTGSQTRLLAEKRLTAHAGEFLFNGNSIELKRALRLLAETGEFDLTGQEIRLLASRILNAVHGSFALTGYAVEFSRFGEIITPARVTFQLDSGLIKTRLDSGRIAATADTGLIKGKVNG